MYRSFEITLEGLLVQRRWPRRPKARQNKSKRELRLRQGEGKYSKAAPHRPSFGEIRRRSGYKHKESGRDLRDNKQAPEEPKRRLRDWHASLLGASRFPRMFKRVAGSYFPIPRLCPKICSMFMFGHSRPFFSWIWNLLCSLPKAGVVPGRVRRVCRVVGSAGAVGYTGSP